MIRYSLSCKQGHGFESWFKSASAFDDLKAAGMISCPECQETDVRKSLMAPQVQSDRKPEPAADPGNTVSNTPDPEIAKAIQVIREHVEKTSDYVGDRFAVEARAMHAGEMPHRPIYGEVRAEDARKLKEDGIPAVPLPFVPKQKTN